MYSVGCPTIALGVCLAPECVLSIRVDCDRFGARRTHGRYSARASIPVFVGRCILFYQLAVHPRQQPRSMTRAMQVVQDALQQHIIYSSTIAAVLRDSLDDDTCRMSRHSSAAKMAESFPDPLHDGASGTLPTGQTGVNEAVPLSHRTLELLGWLKQHTALWAQQLDHMSTAILTESCLKAHLWEDVTQLFEQRKAIKQVPYKVRAFRTKNVAMYFLYQGCPRDV